MINKQVLFLVNILGGLMFGYNIGVVSMYTNLVQTNAECTGFKDDIACTSIKHDKCRWDNFSRTCNYPDTLVCSAYKDKESCKTESKCLWDAEGKTCKRVFGWTAVQQGLFGAGMCLGGMPASVFSGKLAQTLGRRGAFNLMAVCFIGGAVLTIVGRAIFSFALQVVARIIIGLAVGMVCVLCPLTIDALAPKLEKHEGAEKGSLSSVIGVQFQIFCTFGIVSAAAVGAGLGLTQKSTGKQNIESRLFALVAISIIPAVAFLMNTLKVPEDGETEEEHGGLRKDDHGHIQHEDHDSQSWTWGSVAPKLLVAFFLCTGQQMTGINGIMTYGPKITKSAGLEAYTGNLIIMAWNFLTTLASIPLAKRLSRRNMFCGCLLIVSIGCFLTGFPALALHDKTAKNSIAGIGIIIFIAAFEIGMGPLFFILACELFPAAFRETGCAITNGIQLTYNLIMNFGFPLALTALSTSHGSYNEDEGMGKLFMIFGVIGVVCVILLWPTLPSSEQKEEEEDQ